jgi:ankyrin repeat protein
MNPEIEKLADYIYDNDFNSFKNGLLKIDPLQLSNYQFENGDTLLICAIAEKRPEFIEALLRFNVDPNAHSRDESPLCLAVYWDAGSEVIHLLLEHGANPNAGTAGEGFDALTLAVQSNNSELVKMLIQKGANVNSTNYGSMTPLIMSCINKNKEIALLLLEKGADKNIGADGITPLEIATGDTELLRMLKNWDKTAL